MAQALWIPPPTDGARDLSDIGWDKLDASTLDVIRWAPCWMTTSERLLLFSLVFCGRPRRYLEIGCFKGGSTLLAGAAMDASRNRGRMVCLDPSPMVDAEHWKRVEHRATLLPLASPEGLEEAARVAAGRFDFILVDGDHSRDGVLRDLGAILPHADERAQIVCHDGYHPEVGAAISAFVLEHADRLLDLGLFTRDVSFEGEGANRSGPWGGLRVLQCRPAT
jgi:hypothetical protein